MVYIINLLTSSYLGTLASKYNRIGVFLLMYISLIWTIIIGGQYGVGTDYFTYLQYFNNPDSLVFFVNRGEWLFGYLTMMLQSLGITGQGVFFVYAAICNILSVLIFYKIDKKNIGIILFLFITTSTMFHNQMNGLRQCLAIYLITLAVLYLIESRKIVFFILVLIAYFIHNSAIIILIVLPLYKWGYKKSFLQLMLIGSAIISLIPGDYFLLELMNYVPKYSHYLEKDYTEDISFFYKLSKLMLIPFYYVSITLFYNSSHSFKTSCLFNVGIISFSIRIACLMSSVTNRVGSLFLILSIIPLYIFLIHIKRKNYIIWFFTCMLLFVIYFIKVVLFPMREYDYSFWLFN